MKNTIMFFKRNAVSLSILAGIVFLLSACNKLSNSTIHTPTSGLMAFNLVPDKDAISISLSGNMLMSSPLYFNNYTGNYLSIYAGNRDISSFDYPSSTQLATTNQLFEDSAYYSLFVIGANGNYRNMVVKDNFDSLNATSGNAYIRYINAIPDSTNPLVTVSSSDANLFNNDTPFATVTDFKEVTPGNVDISVSNGTTINKSRTITVEGGKIYTVLLSGMPDATDTTKAVQIKYIQNGTLTP